MNPPMMQSALRITTKVLPGDKVEIQVPPGSEGQEVEVFVVFPPPASINRFSLTPEERREKGLTFVQGLPEKSAQLPDEALHRDTMYD